MALHINFRFLQAWSKPVQSPASDKASSSLPGPAEAASSTGRDKKKFIDGMRSPGWLNRRLKGKLVQPEKVAKAQACAPDFAKKLEKLRAEFLTELDRYLTNPDRKPLLLTAKFHELPNEQILPLKAALTAIRKASVLEREKIEAATDLSENEKKAKLDMIGEMTSHEKRELEALVLRRTADHAQMGKDSAIWHDGSPLQEFKGEKWRLTPTKTNLGSGSFGSVVLLRSENDNIFAGKLASKNTRGAMDALRNELDCFRQVYQKAGTHPNLVNVYGMANVEINGSRQPVLLMEGISGVPSYIFFETLSTFHQSGKITSAEYFGALQFLLAGVAQALAHIEKAGIVHGDIAPKNIMISDESCEAKVIDMGVSQRHGAKKLVGTPGFLAWNDHLGDEGLTGKSDVFSFAATTVEAIEGHAKGYKDPGNGKWKRMEPDAGAVQMDYLVPRPKGHDHPKNASDVETIGQSKFRKVKKNQATTSYVAFVNKQLLRIDPETNVLRYSKPEERDSVEGLMRHPFLSDRMLEDNEQEKAVIRKVFDLMRMNRLPQAPESRKKDNQPQLPDLESDYGETPLEDSIWQALNSSVWKATALQQLKKRRASKDNHVPAYLTELQELAKRYDIPKKEINFDALLTEHAKATMRKEGDKLLASLTSNLPWFDTLKTLAQEPVKSGIGDYDVNGAGQASEPEQPRQNNAFEREKQFLDAERSKLEEHFPGTKLHDTVDKLRKYADDATLVLKGIGKISPTAREYASLAPKLALIKERKEIAQEFLRRYERSQRAEH